MARPTILTQRALTWQAGSSFSLAYTIHADTTFARVSVVWDKSGSVEVLSCSGTLGGQALTPVDATPAFHAATDTYCQEFYLKNPPTGSQTLALTIAGAGGATEVYAAVTNDLKDVNLTTPIRAGSVQATSGLTDASSHWSQTITSSTNDLTVSTYSGANQGVTGSDQTVDGAVNNTGAYSGASDHGTTGAASVTHVWTSGSGGSDAACMFGYSIQGTAATSAAVTGTGGSGMSGNEVRAGAKTLILTLTGDTFVAAGAAFDAVRQAIIDGIDSGSAPTWGWDAIRSSIPVTAVVRTSATVVTITLPALAGYQSDSDETLTITIPAAALTLAVAIVASPTITIGDTDTDLSPVTAYTMVGTATRTRP
jgi:hypothetical protein